jgi:GT2 family glycosyltransferase
MQALSQGSPRNASRFRFTQALPVGEGLAVLGHTDDEHPLRVLNLLFDDGREIRLPLDRGDVDLVRTPHPARQQAGAPDATGRGFVIWVPARLLRGQQPMLSLNDQVAELERAPQGTAASIVTQAALLATYGTALGALARRHGDKALAQALSVPLAALVEQRAVAMLGAVDEAWRCDNLLLVIGRWHCEPSQLAALRLHAGANAQVDVFAATHNIPLSARDGQGALLRATHTGFVLLQNLASLPAADTLSLHVATHSLGAFSFTLRPQPCDPAALPEILAQHPALAAYALPVLRRELQRESQRDTHKVLALAERASFNAHWPHARASGRYEGVWAASITAACALEDQGLLLIGTMALPEAMPLQLWLHAPDDAPLDITSKLISLPVDGSAEQLAAVLPQASRLLQFVLHAPRVTHGGARRLLRLVMPGVPDLWLRIETPELQGRGARAARELLGKLPQSSWLWRNFGPVLDRGLGTALQWLGKAPAPRAPSQVHEFGTPPKQAAVSIIVPLYGRNDFLRHQLAQFCDDTDFTTNIDLIYVVDDPTIEIDTLNLAGRYQPLFRVPFRVVTYGENRGFAGANNAAAAVARAPLLLMMNSDVLPQHPGWVSTLRKALTRLPRCGMVAPLLQYADGSVQHAGMAATRQFANPDLIFSMHPGKGTAWEGSEKPSVHPMLTGACLLLRKKDFDAVGGLDEGYLVGDFEDSDFSLRIRALGKQLYLVPGAKLWHLERQSQYLGANVRGVRDMLTLYNAWRYRNKIAAGELLDPEADARCA